MNFISNNCTGASLYGKLAPSHRPNPFFWSKISLSNFIRLIDNFDSLDFNDIEVKINHKRTRLSPKNSVQVIIGDITVNFIHHIFHDEDGDIVRKHNRYSRDIINYVSTCWKESVKNMLQCDLTEFSFVYGAYETDPSSDTDLGELVYMESPYPIYVVAKKDVIERYPNPNCVFIEVPNEGHITASRELIRYMDQHSIELIHI